MDLQHKIFIMDFMRKTIEKVGSDTTTRDLMLSQIVRIEEQVKAYLEQNPKRKAEYDKLRSKGK